ncbi:NDR1/HIN1-like protein 6 [Herrania umbratica]|uniref:NDR1/HIN1-like protein 6 n=1 Tax=Herrania umbratica TaxID=108875 RepID=A0A6J1B1Q7_9ROSI|nr:NDR1/HIN1-like protein 6 [Herrania umbratica]
MARQHVETNPHFIGPDEELTPELRDHLPNALLRSRRDHDQRPPPRGPRELQPPQDERLHPRHLRDQRPYPLGPSRPAQHHEDQPHPPLHVWVPPPHHEDQRRQPQHRQPQQPEPLGIWAPRAPVQGPAPKKQKRSRTRKEVGMQPQVQDQHPRASLIQQEGESTRGSMTPKPEGQQPHEHRPHSSIFLPRVRRTKPVTWFAAAFCIIFWLAVIIGGLIVLVVYLVFRPRSPRFDVTSVTLNAAYLDMGYLLNADLTMLANFTNPNKKVRVDFSSMYLDLYFENTRIATQYIEPFSAARRQSMFANIHMVTSQVRLSVKETLLLQKQIQNNRVMFTVKGEFRARSNFGSVWSYSYWLHGRCSIMVSSPPTGVLRDKRCRTKQ